MASYKTLQFPYCTRKQIAAFCEKKKEQEGEEQKYFSAVNGICKLFFVRVQIQMVF